MQCLNCNESISLLKQNLCRSSLETNKQNKTKGHFQTTLLSAKNWEGRSVVFQGFLLFFCCLCCGRQTLQKKNWVLISAFPQLYQRAAQAVFSSSTVQCTNAVPPSFRQQRHSTILVSNSCIQKSVALAAGTLESSLVCCCCKKPGIPGPLFSLKPEFVRSLRNLPYLVPDAEPSAELRPVFVLSSCCLSHQHWLRYSV